MRQEGADCVRTAAIFVMPQNALQHDRVQSPPSSSRAVPEQPPELLTEPHAVARLRNARLARSSKPFLARGGSQLVHCANPNVKIIFAPQTLEA